MSPARRRPGRPCRRRCSALSAPSWPLYEAHKAFEIALSDGGVFDNLGVNVLEPGRDPSISVNVSNVTHILCLNAGAGPLPMGARTLWLVPRLKQSFEIAHR